MRNSTVNTLTVQRWLKILAAVVAVLLVIVWEHVESRRMERALKSMRRETDLLTYDNARMEMQINQWMSPSHLDLYAKKQLGMVPLDAKRIIGVEQP